MSRDAVPGDSIARNSAFALATQLTTAAFTAALTLYLARALGPDEFGVFSLAVGIGAVVLLPADFGITQSAARFLAERRGNRAEASEVLRTATRLKLLVSGSVCAALFLLAGPIAAGFDEAGLDWAIRGIAIAIFGQSLMLMYVYAGNALRRTSLNFRVVLTESALELGASVALVAAGAGAAGATFGRAGAYLVGAGIGALLLMRLVGRRRAGARRLPVKHIAGYAGALLIVDGAYALFSQLDVILIGAIMSATAAGLFQAPLRLVTFLHYPGLALAAGVAPRLAREGGAEPDIEPFITALRYLLVVQALLTAVAVVWAEPIVDILLGPKYAESAEVLRALGPFIFLSGIAPVISLGVNYLGEARRRVPIAIAAVAINAAIDVALIPEIGIVAGAIGTDVAYAVYVPAHFWVARRIVALPLRPLGVTLARTLAAGGAAAGVLALFGTSPGMSPLELVGGGLAALAVYAAVLFALRELTGAELRQARALLRRGRGSP